MPERVTKEERIVSLAIEKARKAKEELSAKQRKNIEPTQVLEIDTDPEVEKIKRPKVQDASKITNQTQKKEGYGLAGESLKKAERTIEQDNEAYDKAVKQLEYEFKNALRKIKIFGKASSLSSTPNLKELENAIKGMEINIDRKDHNNLRLRQGKENVPPYKKK
tara:strand:+ start:80 stop:571 length:492 start_codon:yes stop_codon:yes gene_type:complete